jgi:hypothetical protein
MREKITRKCAKVKFYFRIFSRSSFIVTTHLPKNQEPHTDRLYHCSPYLSRFP